MLKYRGDVGEIGMMSHRELRCMKGDTGEIRYGDGTWNRIAAWGDIGRCGDTGEMQEKYMRDVGRCDMGMGMASHRCLGESEGRSGEIFKSQ